MVAMERIAQMKANMRRCLANADLMAECHMPGVPAAIGLCFQDCPGIQIFDGKKNPLLPDFIRDEEQAITLWNALTNSAPIDPAWFDA